MAKSDLEPYTLRTPSVGGGSLRAFRRGISKESWGRSLMVRKVSIKLDSVFMDTFGFVYTPQTLHNRAKSTKNVPPPPPK